MLNEKKSCNDLELCAMRLEALAAAESANWVMIQFLIWLLSALYF